MIDILLYLLSVFFFYWAITSSVKMGKITFQSVALMVFYNLIIAALIAIAVGTLALAVV